MTRGDFILSILTSLIATILAKFVSTFYPHLRKAPFKELAKQLMRGFVPRRPLKRILAPCMVLVVATLSAVKLPVPTALAPDYNLLDSGMIVVRPTNESFETISAVTGNPQLSLWLVEEAKAAPTQTIMIRPSDYGVR